VSGANPDSQCFRETFNPIVPPFPLFSYAEAQNWARELGETPANLMTPTIFCKVVQAKLASFKNISTIAHDTEWAKAKGMGSFLSVTQGSDEPAKMLEIHYKGAGADKPTLGLVGKGITFDTGGYALKGGLGMKVGVGRKGNWSLYCG
jgi:aminopeptidase